MTCPVCNKEITIDHASFLADDTELHLVCSDALTVAVLRIGKGNGYAATVVAALMTNARRVLVEQGVEA